MSTTAVLTAIWPAIRRILGKLGRWVINDVARDGTKAVVSYLQMRVRVFRRRLGRVRTEIRERWLKARIRRYLAAARWLRSDDGQKLKGQVAKRAVRLARQELPEEAIEESFQRWSRAA